MNSRKVATVYPPAKLNLFLELLGKREDGFHQIDTVMAAINWCDRLQLERTKREGVQLQCRWRPSAELAARDWQKIGSEKSDLEIPSDESNLVHRALQLFSNRFQISGGFRCRLDKRIPAGAGMGGASSDAASALLAAARLCDLKHQSLGQELTRLAEQLGSDVPFFLGLPEQFTVDDSHQHGITAARAQGRGTELTPVLLPATLHFVVVFPGSSLSTASVYAASRIPDAPRLANGIVEACAANNIAAVKTLMMNRLSEPACELEPMIQNTLQSMRRWQRGACQLTGSGSACFAVLDSARAARRLASALLAHGVGWVQAASVKRLPAAIEVLEVN